MFKSRSLLFLGTLLLGSGILAACAPTPPPGSRVAPSRLYLAVHRNLGGGPAGLVGGKLIDERGCLAYETIDGVALPVWPPSARAWDVDGRTVLADSDGRVVAVIGEESYFGGGFDYRLKDIQDLMDSPIPSDCQLGKYLLVTDLRNFPGP